jgi:hypothetical protein
MTRRRWIADEVSGNRAALIGDHARHLSQVLRARVGEEFDISTGSEIRQGRVSEVYPDRVEFELGEVLAQPKEAEITVALSIFKFDRMEWAMEKCAELGVTRIIPVIAERTEKYLAAAAIKRVERWRRIAAQASEQSRRVSPPEISSPVKLAERPSSRNDIGNPGLWSRGWMEAGGNRTLQKIGLDVGITGTKDSSRRNGYDSRGSNREFNSYAIRRELIISAADSGMLLLNGCFP